MTKRKPKRKLIDKTVWCNRGWVPVHFGFCPSEKAWAAEMKRLGVKAPPYPTTDAACTHMMNSKQHKACSLVTMHNRPATGGQKVAMLVHEAEHVWRRMKKLIGETKPSAEFEAYSMQNIVQELIEAFEMTRGPLVVRRAR